jgi:hypothetical protein
MRLARETERDCEPDNSGVPGIEHLEEEEREHDLEDHAPT